MNNSLTIVIPNRNRSIRTIKRSVSSIVSQLSSNCKLVIVDYGSALNYQAELEKLVNTTLNLELLLCPTQGQLWNKSRCINMVLKSCITSHFMVCDMDLIWHPEFIKKNITHFSSTETSYYTVGFMTKNESEKENEFQEYAVKFQTNKEATGISVFPTKQLLEINGFDEFYHGWGSEDTDVHVRLKNAGYEVRFRESELYFKHQHHDKAYRSVYSKYPFHSHQERVNASYLKQAIKSKRVRANNRFKMGIMPLKLDYLNLEMIEIQSYQHDIKGILHYCLEKSGLFELRVNCKVEFSLKRTLKNNVKTDIPKRLKITQANDLILEWVITNARHCSYFYEIKNDTIYLKINII